MLKADIQTSFPTYKSPFNRLQRDWAEFPSALVACIRAGRPGAGRAKSFFLITASRWDLRLAPRSEPVGRNQACRRVAM